MEEGLLFSICSYGEYRMKKNYLPYDEKIDGHTHSERESEWDNAKSWCQRERERDGKKKDIHKYVLHTYMTIQAFNLTHSPQKISMIAVETANSHVIYGSIEHISYE